MNIEPIDAPLGARVSHVDLARPLEAAALSALLRALYRHRVLVIAGQRLSPAAQVAFARALGEPYVETYDNLQLEAHPEIMKVGNVGPVLSQEEFRLGAGFWHTDRAYAPDPDALTMLYCVKAMAEGGETYFTDTVAACAALAPAMRARIDGLVARHRYGEGELEDWETAVHPMRGDQAAALPPAGRHPLVRRHSVTGEPALYAVAGSAVDVEGLDAAGRRTLLGELKRHVVDERFVYRHRYREGDLVIWDNTATLHCAAPIPPAAGAGTERLLHRVVTLGLPRIPMGVRNDEALTLRLCSRAPF